MIFENDGEEDFFEIQLTESEVDKLKNRSGVYLDIPYGLKELHVIVRKTEG
jgi:hypothetical protein